MRLTAERTKTKAQFMYGELRKRISLLRQKYKTRAIRLVNPKAIVFEKVEIVITERCTLKCKNCANLIQYYTQPKDVEINRVLRDIDLFMKYVDYVHVVSPIGGETFMVKRIPEILLHIQKYKGKYSYIRAITNGTIVPSEPVLLALKKAKAFISISDYGELSSDLDKLVAELRKRKIRCGIRRNNWIYYQQVLSDCTRTNEDTNAVFKACHASCMTLIGGKLYHCPFLAHGDRLRVFPADKQNYLDLTDTSLSYKSIRDWASRTEMPPGCRFCSGYSDDLPVIPIAEQIKSALPYHRFDD